MKKIILFTLLLVPSLLFSQDSLKIKLNAFLDEWHDAAARADMKSYFDKIDEDGVYIGTDAMEYWSKQEFYNWSKPYFDKGKAWTFKAVERNFYLSQDNTFAWFDEKLQASGYQLRGSGVLMIKGGEWKIMQYVLSLPLPNERFNEVLNVIKPQ